MRCADVTRRAGGTRRPRGQDEGFPKLFDSLASPCQTLLGTALATGGHWIEVFGSMNRQRDQENKLIANIVTTSKAPVTTSVALVTRS